MDQITVVFEPGTTPTRIDEINAGIGATIVIAPRLSTAYRMKLPPTITLLEAYPHYRSQPEVAGILPAINYAEQALMLDEGTQTNHTIANLPDGWETIQNAIGSVGSRQVGVGVIEGGIDILHPDLILNIGINQEEIPAAVATTLSDVDGDTVISFFDLR